MRLDVKYRPQKLDEVIGQGHVVTALKAMIARGDIPHLLFSGPPGCGKTSTAYALAHELGWGIVELNASDERGIQTIREKVKRLAFTVGKRIILLDEADRMTDEAQHALRRIMEKAKDSRFILTCNEDWRIIDPIKSRCAIFKFRKLTKKEVLMILILIIKGERLTDMVTPELKEALIALADYVDGDARKAINMLSTLIAQGRELTKANILSLIPTSLTKEAIIKAIEGDYMTALKALEDAYIEGKLEPSLIINRIYETVKELDVDEYIKIRLFDRLAEIERNIKIGCNPLIQLASFLATAWIAKRVPKGVMEQ